MNSREFLQWVSLSQMALGIDKTAAWAPIDWLGAKIGKVLQSAGKGAAARAKARQTQSYAKEVAEKAAKETDALATLGLDPKVHAVRKASQEAKAKAAILTAGGGHLPGDLSHLDPVKSKELADAAKNKWKMVAAGLGAGVVGGKLLGGDQGVKIIK